MAGVVSLGLGIASAVGSTIKTIDANDAAAKTKAEDQQLLNEANQQAAQVDATPGLIAQRNAQEQSLNPITSPSNANGTSLSGPLGIAPLASATPKNLLGT